MTIQGYQFDKCKVTPEADAALYYQLNNKQNHVIAGYKNEMNVTSSGLNVYVDTGCALVMGRYCEITNQEQLSVMANTEGYVCITIDLTETNTAEGVPGSADYVVTNNQLRVELVTELVQQDLFNDGQVYTFPLAKVVTNGTGVTITKTEDSYLRGTKKIRIDSFTADGSYFISSHKVDFSKYWDKLVKLTMVWGGYTPGDGGVNHAYRVIDYDKKTIERLFGKLVWEPFVSTSAPELALKSYTFNNAAKTVSGNDNNLVAPNNKIAIKEVWAEVYV